MKSAWRLRTAAACRRWTGLRPWRRLGRRPGRVDGSLGCRSRSRTAHRGAGTPAADGPHRGGAAPVSRLLIGRPRRRPPRQPAGPSSPDPCRRPCRGRSDQRGRAPRPRARSPRGQSLRSVDRDAKAVPVLGLTDHRGQLSRVGRLFTPPQGRVPRHPSAVRCPRRPARAWRDRRRHSRPASR